MVRYLRKTKTGLWEFLPPKKVRDAGVCQRQVWQDGRAATAEAKRLNKLIDSYRKGQIVVQNLSQEDDLKQLATNYLSSPAFGRLKSQKPYAYLVGRILNTEVKGNLFGHFKLKSITSSLCAEVYGIWASQSLASATQLVRIFSILMSYGMSVDAVDRNPMAKVKKAHHKPNTHEWTKEQVTQFVETAFTDFKYRNIGILCLLAYEWCQRPIDMRLLRWSSLDLENNVCTITQEKRGATVHLPIYDNIKTILLDQKEHFGWQEWVVPYLASDDTLKPMNRTHMNRLASEVKEKAGLPKHLALGSLRRTGIMEMVEAGLDQVGIMPVSGHMNLSSISPYMKHTEKAAKKSLDVRREGRLSAD